jgi:hypothetical protein
VISSKAVDIKEKLLLNHNKSPFLSEEEFCATSSFFPCPSWTEMITEEFRSSFIRRGGKESPSPSVHASTAEQNMMNDEGKHFCQCFTCEQDKELSKEGPFPACSSRSHLPLPVEEDSQTEIYVEVLPARWQK